MSSGTFSRDQTCFDARVKLAGTKPGPEDSQMDDRSAVHREQVCSRLSISVLRLVTCIFAFLLLVAGCSNKPPLGTITGEVTFDAKPVEDGRISLIPVD